MKHLKRTIIAALTAALLISLAACGNSSANLPVYSQGLDANGYWAGIKAGDIVKLPEYMGITFPEDVTSVTQEDRDSAIAGILEDNPIVGQVYDRAVEDGDTVNIDYIGRIDGEEFSGGNTQGAGAEVTIGVTQYIDDFLEQLIGHMPGETFDVEVTFPEDYGTEALNGKDAVFETTVNFIRTDVMPELTDAYVAEYLKGQYHVETVADLNTYVETRLLQNMQDAYVQDYLYDNAEIGEVPESMMEAQRASLLQNYKDMAQSYGYDLETFVGFYGYSSSEELLADYEDDLQEQAVMSLLYQAVAEDQKLKVTEKEVQAYLADVYPELDYETAKTVYGLPYLKSILIPVRILDMVEENAVK